VGDGGKEGKRKKVDKTYRRISVTFMTLRVHHALGEVFRRITKRYRKTEEKNSQGNEPIRAIKITGCKQCRRGEEREKELLHPGDDLWKKNARSELGTGGNGFLKAQTLESHWLGGRENRGNAGDTFIRLP